jgi:hypothetical protein
MLCDLLGECFLTVQTITTSSWGLSSSSGIVRPWRRRWKWGAAVHKTLGTTCPVTRHIPEYLGLLKLFYTVHHNCCFFFVLLAMHLGSVLVNNQLDGQFFFHIFIPILYTFQAPLCSSSGEAIVLIHLVYVTLCRWPFSVQVWMELQFLPNLHTRPSPI